MKSTIINNLLKRGEKYFQIDVEYFLTSNFWLIISYVVTALKGLILSILLSRILENKAFGEYNFLLSLVGAVGIFGLPGMASAIAQAVARGYDATYRNATRVIFRWSLLGSLCLLILPVLLPNQVTTERMITFAALAVIFPFTVFNIAYPWYLLGAGNFRQMMFANVSNEIIHLIAILSTILITRNVLILVCISVGIQAITYGIYHIRTLKNLPLEPVDQESIAYGKKLTFSSSLPHFKLYGDKILLTLFMDYETLAIYAIAAILPGQIYAIGKIIGASVFPKSATQSYEILIATIRKKLIYLFLLLLMLSIFTSIIAPYAVPLLFSQRYITSIWYTQLLAFSILFRSTGVVLQRIMESHQRTVSIYVLNIGIPAIEFIMMFILIPPYGLMGLIGSKYISDITYLFLSIIFLYKRPGNSFPKNSI